MSEIVLMIATGGSQGGGGGDPLALHPVRPPRLPDLPPLPVPGGAHCQRGDGRDAGRLVAPGVCQQSRWEAHRSVRNSCQVWAMMMMVTQVPTSPTSVRSLVSPLAPAPAPWTPPPSPTSGRSPSWTRWSGCSIRKRLESSSTRKTYSPCGPWRSWTLMQRKLIVYFELSASFPANFFTASTWLCSSVSTTQFGLDGTTEGSIFIPENKSSRWNKRKIISDVYSLFSFQLHFLSLIVMATLNDFFVRIKFPGSSRTRPTDGWRWCSTGGWTPRSVTPRSGSPGPGPGGILTRQ